MKNFSSVLQNIKTVSKITKLSNKKLRILLSALVTNIVVFFDIIIIIIFSSFFSDTIFENRFITIFIENKKFLPLIIFFRFVFVLLDKLNIRHLQLKISENLKDFLIRDIYQKGNYSISDATYYITQLTEHISYFYGALGIVFGGILQLVVYLSYLLIENPQILLTFFTISIVIFLPSIYFLKMGRRYMDSTFKLGQEVNKKTQRVIDNLFLIKILKTNNLEIVNFNNSNNELTSSQLKNFLFATLNSISPNFLVTFTLSLYIVLYGLLKNITLEFIGITLRMVQTIGVINNGMNMMINSYIHIEKIITIKNNNEVINSQFKAKFYDKKDTVNLVELKNINFKYFENTSLFFENLNINISENSHIVVTGQNGSGKSTLLGIVANVLQPSSGEIIYRTNKIGYIGVTPLVVEGSLKENLLYGNNLDIKDEEIIYFLEKFSLFSDKADLQRLISNKTLSSGQFQKIAFIRAILAKPDLLILDEAISNLDTETKKIVLNYLKKQKITILNSTHNAEAFEFDFRIDIQMKEDKRIVSFL